MPDLEESKAELLSEAVQKLACNLPKVWRNVIPGTTELDYGFAELAILTCRLVLEHEKLVNRDAELRGENL